MSDNSINITEDWFKAVQPDDDDSFEIIDPADVLELVPPTLGAAANEDDSSTTNDFNEINSCEDLISCADVIASTTDDSDAPSLSAPAINDDCNVKASTTDDSAAFSLSAPAINDDCNVKASTTDDSAAPSVSVSSPAIIDDCNVKASTTDDSAAPSLSAPEINDDCNVKSSTTDDSAAPSLSAPEKFCKHTRTLYVALCGYERKIDDLLHSDHTLKNGELLRDLPEIKSLCSILEERRIKQLVGRTQKDEDCKKVTIPQMIGTIRSVCTMFKSHEDLLNEMKKIIRKTR